MSATGKRCRTRALCDAGFTLIEMLVVLAVGALVAGILFPRVDAIIAHQTFRSSEALVMLGLTGARAAAIRTGRVNAFALAADGGGFISGADVAAALPEGVRLTTSVPTLRFFRDGSSDPAILTLTSPREEKRFRVVADTGLIEAIR